MITCCPRRPMPGRRFQPRSRRHQAVVQLTPEAPFHPSMTNRSCAGCGSYMDLPRLVITANGAAMICDACHQADAW